MKSPAIIEKHIIYFLIFTVIIVGSSCSIFKKPLKEESAEFLFQKLKENESKYQYLSAKYNIDATLDKKENSFNGNIRILKDSIIWISISPALGIEAARLLITNDSVKMINRIDNSYFMGDFEYINKLFDVDMDFEMIQALLTGNDLNNYAIDVFKSSVDKRRYKLSTLNRSKIKKKLKQEKPKIVLHDIWLDPNSYKIKEMHLKEPKANRKLSISFNNFTNVSENNLFPLSLYLKVDAQKKIECNIQYSKIIIGKSLDFPFTIPANYTRVDFSKQ